jgi:AcrR family transcriptional regulator
MPPKPMRVADPQRLDNILASALRCFAERGYYQTSVSQIAAGAGVSAGYLYRHFTGKRALYRYLHDYHGEETHRYLLYLLEQHQWVSLFLRSAIAFWVQMAREEPQRFSFLYQMENAFSEQGPSEADETARHLARRIKSLGDGTGEINPSTTPEQIYLLLFGLPQRLIVLRQRALFHADGPTKADVEYLTSVMLIAWQ